MITLTKDHRYVDDVTGAEWPGVTTVIREAGLMGWIPDDPFYAERGTAIHEATALWDLGVLDEETLDLQIDPYLDAWKRYRSDMMDPDISLMIEQIVVNTAVGYCGTMDRAGVDIKTGALCKWHILQAAAYYHACPVRPPVWHSVYLKDDGTYKLTIYRPSELFAAFKVFCAALMVYNWRKENGVK